MKNYMICILLAMGGISTTVGAMDNNAFTFKNGTDGFEFGGTEYRFNNTVALVQTKGVFCELSTELNGTFIMNRDADVFRNMLNDKKLKKLLKVSAVASLYAANPALMPTQNDTDFKVNYGQIIIALQQEESRQKIASFLWQMVSRITGGVTVLGMGTTVIMGIYMESDDATRAVSMLTASCCLTTVASWWLSRIYSAKAARFTQAMCILEGKLPEYAEVRTFIKASWNVRKEESESDGSNAIRDILHAKKNFYRDMARKSKSSQEKMCSRGKAIVIEEFAKLCAAEPEVRR